MRTRLFLTGGLILLLFACKKTEEGPARINLRQQASRILITATDSASGTEVTEQTFRYFYNDSLERYDSIIANGSSFVFDYSLLNSAQVIRINYSDGLTPYSEIRLNGALSALQSLTEIYPADTTQNTRYTFSYNSDSRISGLQAAGSNILYQKSLDYKDDSLFIRTQRSGTACSTTDTLINTARSYLNAQLPYLLFADIRNTCSGFGNALLGALSSSNYSYKLPLKVVNGPITKDYRYVFDSERRISQVYITIRNSTTPAVVTILRMDISY